MSLPNIPCQTLGGKYFWDTLEVVGGWKLQRNILTDHYRILDSANIRQAWSLEEGQIRKTFRQLTDIFSIEI